MRRMGQRITKELWFSEVGQQNKIVCVYAIELILLGVQFVFLIFT